VTVQGSGVVLPAGFAAVGGVLGRGGEALVRHVRVEDPVLGATWGGSLAPESLAGAWTGQDRAWVDLSGWTSPAAGSVGEASDSRLTKGSQWALRLGYRGDPPASWEGLEVAWEAEQSTSPGSAPLRWAHVQVLAADPVASRLLALPAALGWWPDPDGSGRRWWWTVSPLGDRRTVEDLCASGAVSVATAARWGLDLLTAVTSMHGLRLVHLDVNPGNTLLAGGRARLADFGTLRGLHLSGADGSLEALFVGHFADDRAHPMDCLIVGTDDFAAPWLRCHWLDENSDDLDVWTDLDLARRADVWGVLRVVQYIIDHTSEPPRSVDDLALVEGLGEWLSGNPAALPLPGTARQDLEAVLRAVAVGTVSELMSRRGRGLPHQATAGGAGELGASPGRSLDLFTGRERERERLRRHLVDSSPHGSGLLVTGPAGVGKSALLGWLSLTGSVPTPIATGTFLTAPSAVLTVDVALDAAGASATGLRDRLAAALGVTDPAPEPGGSDVLVRHVAELAKRWGRPVVVVVDGVDEAQVEIDPDAAGAGAGQSRPPGVVAGDWIAGLAGGCGPGVLRLVVGCRAGSPAGVSLVEAARPGGWAPTLEVAHDSQTAVDDLTGYLHRLLSLDDQWEQPQLSEATRGLIERTAGQIAQAAGGNFLVGQLTAIAFRPDLQVGRPVPADQFPAQVGAAYAQFIQRRFTARAAERVLELLRPLALTGTVPRYGPHWAGLAAALQPGTPDWTETILEETLADPGTAGLFDYLVNADTAPDDGEYVRLYHQALADWLLDTIPSHLRHGLANERTANYLHGARPPSGWQDATAWHTGALADHAGQAATGGRPAAARALLTDLDPLTHLEPKAAMGMANRALGADDLTDPAASIARAYQTCKPELLLEQSPAQRVAQLEFTVLRNPAMHGAAHLLKAAVLEGEGPRMVTVWAHPHPSEPGLIGRHNGWVRSLTPLIGPNGEPLVVSGDQDGEVRVWMLSGQRWAPARHDGQPGLLGLHTGAVLALATLSGPAGQPVVISGGQDGEVRAWTLAGEPWPHAAYDGQLGLLGRHTGPVNAMVTLIGPGGEALVFSSNADGSVETWSLTGDTFAGQSADGSMGLLGPHAGKVCSLLALIGPAGDPLVVSGNYDGTVRAWTLAGDPWAGARRNNEPGLLGQHTDPVTALLLLVGPGGEPLVVSGSEDRTVRVWMLCGEPWSGAQRDDQPGLLGRHGYPVTILVAVAGPGGEPLVVFGSLNASLRVWTLGGWPWSRKGHPPTPIGGRYSSGHSPLVALGGAGGEQFLVSGEMDGKVRAWTVDGGPWTDADLDGQSDLRGQPPKPMTSVTTLLGPDGEPLVVSGSEDGAVRVWASTGEPLAQARRDGLPGLLGQHSERVVSVATLLGPDGEPLVVSVGGEGDLRAWTLSGDTYADSQYEGHSGLLGRHLVPFSMATVVGSGGEPLVISGGARFGVPEVRSGVRYAIRAWTLAGEPWARARHGGQPGLICECTPDLQQMVILVRPGAEPLVISGSLHGEVRVWTLAGKPWAGARHDGQPGLLCQAVIRSLTAMVGPTGEPLVILNGLMQGIGSAAGPLRSRGDQIRDGRTGVWVLTLSGAPWAGARHDGQPGLLSQRLGGFFVTAIVGPGGEPLVVGENSPGEVRVLTLGGDLVNVLGDVSSVAALDANTGNPAEIVVGFKDGTLACLRLQS